MTEEQENIVHQVLFRKETPDERLRFEQWLNEDPEFRDTVELRMKLGGQVRLRERNELKERFQKIRGEMEESERSSPVKQLSQKPWFWAAASIVLLAGVFVLTRTKPTENTTVELAGKSGKADTTVNKSVEQTQNLPPTSDSKTSADPPITRTLLKAIPFYELNEESLGLAGDNKSTKTRPVTFIDATSWQYEFEDTLRLYIPAQEWGRPWKLEFDQTQERYWLYYTQKRRYEILEGLKGKRDLKVAVNED